MEFQLLHFVAFADLTNWSAFTLLRKELGFNDAFPFHPIGEFLRPVRRSMNIEDDILYTRLTVKTKNGGVIQRDEVLGNTIGTKKQFWVKSGDFVMSKIDARNGAFGLVPDDLDKSIVTNDFPVFKVDNSKILSQFLVLIATTEQFVRFAQSCSSGTTNRQRIDVAEFLKKEIPLPSLTEQEAILAEYNAKIEEANKLTYKAKDIQDSILHIIRSYLGIEFLLWERKQGLHFTSLKDIKRWAIWNVNNYSLRKDFPKYTLEQLISISSGKFLPANKQKGNDYFVYGGNGINGTHSEYCFEGKRIIIGRVGEYCGNVHLVDGKYWVTDNAFWSERKKDIFTWEYLEVVLTGLDLNKFRVISAQPSISQSNILELEIPVPSIEEQNRIVQIVQEKRNEIEGIKKDIQSLKVSAIKDFEAKIFKS
ncbi:MAG: restriction endonuclease subunit S [Cytophagales bacterium]